MCGFSEIKKRNVFIKNVKRLYSRTLGHKLHLLETFGLSDEMEFMYALVNLADDISFIPDMIRDGEDGSEKYLTVDNGNSQIFKCDPLRIRQDHQWHEPPSFYNPIPKERYEHWLMDRLISLKYIYIGKERKEMEYTIKFV